MATQTPLGPVPYQPLFCEENAWQIARTARDHGLEARVVFVTNERKHVAMMRQRASKRSDGLIVWDYHVFAVVRRQDTWEAWDPDTTLPMPTALDRYITESFRDEARWEERFRPKLRVVDADALLRGFFSSREHMKDDDGQWLAEPPPWPAIMGTGDAYTLSALRDTSDLRAGPWISSEAVARAFAVTDSRAR